MSRARIRPTREETRQRLFEAAAEVFAEQGIGGASIEAITTAAGFSRGAFYSNFDDKDELVTAMLADHVEQTTRRNLELLARHREPDDFLAALRAVDRSTQDPLGRSPLLHFELLLYAARVSGHGGEVAEFLDARRRIIIEVIEGAGLAETANGRLDSEQLAAALLAMEDGFRLHQLIDAKRTPPDSFLRSISALREALRPQGDAP
jgi:AcrR family transcriptional regulator